MYEIGRVLEKGEKVEWEGKPNFRAFAFGSIVALIFGLIIFILFVWFFIYLASIPFTGKISFVFYILIVPVIFMLIAIVMPLVNVFMAYRNLHYAITNKRVIIQKGIVGRDFETIQFSKITNAEVNVSFSDRFFGKDTGTIMLSTAGTLSMMFGGRGGGYRMRPNTLLHVEEPFKVIKLIKTRRR